MPGAGVINYSSRHPVGLNPGLIDWLSKLIDCHNWLCFLSISTKITFIFIVSLQGWRGGLDITLEPSSLPSNVQGFQNICACYCTCGRVREVEWENYSRKCQTILGFWWQKKGSWQTVKKGSKCKIFSEADEEPWNKRMLGSAGDKGSTCNIFNIVTFVTKTLQLWMLGLY